MAKKDQRYGLDRLLTGRELLPEPRQWNDDSHGVTIGDLSLDNFPETLGKDDLFEDSASVDIEHGTVHVPTATGEWEINTRKGGALTDTKFRAYTMCEPGPEYVLAVDDPKVGAIAQRVSDV